MKSKLSSIPFCSDIGQAADQTTVLFPLRISVYVSSPIMRSNYIKTYKPVYHAQLKKVASVHKHLNGVNVRLAGGSISRVGWKKSRDVISGHLGCHILSTYWSSLHLVSYLLVSWRKILGDAEVKV